MRNSITFCILLLSFITTYSQPVIKGKVIDKNTRQPLEYAVVSIGEKGVTAISDQQGNFESRVHYTEDSIKVSFVGYRSQAVAILKSGLPILITMERGSLDLKTVTIHSLSNNATFHTINEIDLNLRPVNSAQDLKRLVPGLFLGQHQGGG